VQDESFDSWELAIRTYSIPATSQGSGVKQKAKKLAYEKITLCHVRCFKSYKYLGSEDYII
jgi:hypothetical protein